MSEGHAVVYSSPLSVKGRGAGGGRTEGGDLAGSSSCGRGQT